VSVVAAVAEGALALALIEMFAMDQTKRAPVFLNQIILIRA
jgi:hypothetical protein